MNHNGVSEATLQALITHLACPCTYFPPTEDDAPILAAYRQARERGEKEGFWPLLVTVDAVRHFSVLSGGVSRAEGAKVLIAPPESGREVLLRRLRDWRGEIIGEDPSLNWETDILGEVTGGQPQNAFRGYRCWGDHRTLPLVLAEIPVEQPWQVFAGMSFGGWNECPRDLEHMAAAKYWYETYGAVPAVMTQSTLEYILPQPVPKERAEALALEQYGYCADIVDQSFGTVGTLASGLPLSKVWYFWWD